MANQLLTNEFIAKDAAALLYSQCQLPRLVRQFRKNDYIVEGRKGGESLRVRIPPRYVAVPGRVATPQDTTETHVTLSLMQYNVPLYFTSAERTMSLQDFRDNILASAVSELANAIDEAGMRVAAQNFPNYVGTPGTPPSTPAPFLNANAKMTEAGTPIDTERRYCLLSPSATASTVASLAGLFNDADRISEQYITGQMGNKTRLGMRFFESGNVYTHQVGPYTGTPLVNGAGQSGFNLTIDGLTGGAGLRFRKGDRFTIAGVYDVHPKTRVAYPYLKVFQIAEDVNADAGGNAVLPLTTPIIHTPAKDRTVSALPADNAAITVLGTASSSYQVNLAFHRDAIGFAMVDLEQPPGVTDVAYVSDDELNIRLRLAPVWDGINDTSVYRLDAYFGWAVIRPEFGCAIVG